MEPEPETLRRANAELQAWVRDLLEENRSLRQRLAEAEARTPLPTPPLEEPRPGIW